MGTTALIPVDEYLKTSYSPDREYVDGVLLERNAGEKLHSKLQRILILALSEKYPALHVWPELRMRTIGDRHRIPDICVTLTEPGTDVLQDPPFTVMEILSAEDSMSRVIEKLEEYASIGTPNIWLFDPRLRQMFVFEANALRLADMLIASTADTVVKLTRSELFPDRVLS
jgi:Uma2 family endonuclease